jgi:tRNA (guanosine-2'-O-)-methyltransferase
MGMPDGDHMTKKDAVAFTDYLLTFLSDEKIAKLRAVLSCRTHHLTFVLEDFFQEHNISAVIRSAEIFGLQELHVVEKKNQYAIRTGIDRGASQWLDIYRYTNSGACIRHLKEQGYRVIATVAHDGAQSLETMPIDTKMAFLMGTEYAGLSAEALELADTYVTLPMYGFTQSFNVSVCAALCMQSIVSRLHHSSVAWQLPAQQKELLFQRWVYQSVKHAKHHKEHFFSNSEHS